MSMERVEKIKCPDCGQEVEMTIWDSLNADLDPQAKEKLIDGTLFLFQCPKCGHESMIAYSILYHDMKNKVMVYCVPPEDVEFTIKQLAEIEQNLPAGVTSGYTTRVVYNHNDLREKAIIFDNQLDDRIIELVKLWYRMHISIHKPEMDIGKMYFFVENGKFMLQLYADRPLGAEISQKLYEDIKNDFATIVDSPENNNAVIDMDWAMKLLRK